MPGEIILDTVLANWSYFEKCGWTSRSKCVGHYETHPRDWELDLSGLEEWNRQQNEAWVQGQERRNADTRGPSRHDEVVHQVRYWYAQGHTDPAIIQRLVGPLPWPPLDYLTEFCVTPEGKLFTRLRKQGAQVTGLLAESSIRTIISQTPPGYLKQVADGFKPM